LKRVVVLGCGPAGLLAAHAASLNMADVQIFSIPQKSVISGAQYLHRSIPGLTESADGWITYMKTGSRDGYARKVYGVSSIPVSWDLWGQAESKPAWSMQKAYDVLWEMYKGSIVEFDVRLFDVVVLESLKADLYISSLPAPLLCHGGHFFESVDMHIREGFSGAVTVPENTIIYNGHLHHPWHRASNLFGFKSMEYATRPPDDNGDSRLISGVKPTAHNCDCRPDWLRVGRFGQWKRGVLVHHAFEEVELALQQV
jgi:hypothetical protein